MARTPRPDTASVEQSRAPFMEHLNELRGRLWRAVVGVVLCAIVAYLFHEQLYWFLTRPLYDTLARHELATEVKFRTIQGPFMFHMKVALLGGLFFGLPWVLYQLWQFIAPGLYKHEKRLVIPFVVLSTAFFVGGAAFCYYFVVPTGFDFFLEFAVTDGPNKLLPEIAIEDYLDMVVKLLLAFGAIFEMPLAAAFLAGVGLITHRGMIKFWRYATVLAFILAAVLTPPDWVSQVMMAIPLMLLYWLSIGVAWFITTRKERALAAADEAASERAAGDDEPPAAS